MKAIEKLREDLKKAEANLARAVNMSYSTYRRYMREAKELKNAIDRFEFKGEN